MFRERKRGLHMTIVEMRVHMDCPGCENKIRKALQKLKGVDNVDIDMAMQKVLVTGWIDQEKVLETVRKTGRLAELWPFPHNPEYHAFNYAYYNEFYRNPASQFTVNPATHTHFTLTPDTHYSPEPATHVTADDDYYDDDHDRFSTYNYYVHGHNGHKHGYYQEAPYPSAMFTERTTAIFSDENAHGCSIM